MQKLQKNLSLEIGEFFALVVFGVMTNHQVGQVAEGTPKRKKRKVPGIQTTVQKNKQPLEIQFLLIKIT